MIYPDYGALLLSMGRDGVTLIFYDVPIDRLSLVRPGQFTFSVNLPHDGVEYAVSFDLSYPLVIELSRCRHNRAGEAILKALALLAPGQSFDLPESWSAVIHSRLGSPQLSRDELFVPLVVESVA